MKALEVFGISPAVFIGLLIKRRQFRFGNVFKHRAHVSAGGGNKGVKIAVEHLDAHIAFIAPRSDFVLQVLRGDIRGNLARHLLGFIDLYCFVKAV